jgi:oxygen-independent coproporphyrinogen-3 oxidase
LITTCDDGLEAEMYLACIDTLAEAGFEQYEISNFARPRQACRHNVNTWRNEPYVGIGPSAASYGGGERRRNVPHLENYVRMIEGTGRASVECERLDGRARAGECAMLALRLTAGFSIGEFRERTGCDALELFGEMIERFQGLGLLAPFDPGEPRDDRRIKLTRHGLLMADSVMSEFLSPVMAESES